MTTSVRGAYEILDAPSTGSGIHEWRVGSFGAAAREYVQYRPTYPAAAICWGMTGSPGAPQGCDPGSDPVAMSAPQVVDLGVGTGKLTGGLLLFGAQVVAVEPDERMRAEAARLFPPVRTLDGRAERMPLPHGSADAVFIGQALHCFDFDKSLREIHRVLHQSGIVPAPGRWGVVAGISFDRRWCRPDSSVSHRESAGRGVTSAAEGRSGRVIQRIAPPFESPGRFTVPDGTGVVWTDLSGIRRCPRVRCAWIGCARVRCAGVR